MAEPSVKGYQLIDLIGTGAGSEVYKGRQMRTGDMVAIKIVRRGGADSARLFAQIANEYRVARQWTHPNLVRLHQLVVTRPPADPRFENPHVSAVWLIQPGKARQ